MKDGRFCEIEAEEKEENFGKVTAITAGVPVELGSLFSMVGKLIQCTTTFIKKLGAKYGQGIAEDSVFEHSLFRANTAKSKWGRRKIPGDRRHLRLSEDSVAERGRNRRSENLSLGEDVDGGFHVRAIFGRIFRCFAMVDWVQVAVKDQALVKLPVINHRFSFRIREIIKHWEFLFIKSLLGFSFYRFGFLKKRQRLVFIAKWVYGYVQGGNTKHKRLDELRAKLLVCKVAPVLGETKVWQYVTPTKRIFLIDCPGVVYLNSDTKTNIVLKGVMSNEVIFLLTIFISSLTSFDILFSQVVLVDQVIEDRTGHPIKCTNI
uniref:Uncharacterized protein n=1 Tax=Cucumis melo TaxID=3656 RepID=A0A9I9EG53_CUCME